MGKNNRHSSELRNTISISTEINESKYYLRITKVEPANSHVWKQALIVWKLREESHENPRTSLAVGKCILWRRHWSFYCSTNFHCNVKLHQQKKHSVRIMSSEASCAGKGLHHPLGSMSHRLPAHKQKEIFLVLFN